VVATLVVANLGTTCAESAGVAAGLELAGISRYLSITTAALLVGFVVLRGSFHRIENVLLLLSTVFITYVGAASLAHPDWAEAGRGLVVPQVPRTRDALIIVTGIVGTTLAPWGLAFIQSYAADKRLTAADVRFERIDVVSGAALTGLIGAFVLVACAATLNATGHRRPRRCACREASGRSLGLRTVRSGLGRSRTAGRRRRAVVHRLLCRGRVRPRGSARRPSAPSRSSRCPSSA
jgi:Mn2+/Fe2+ NRAMP family transporter